MSWKVGSIAKATLDFKGRLYTYKFKMPEDQSNHGLALAISTEKFLKEKKNRYVQTPPSYNLVMEMLKHNSNYCNSADTEIKMDFFQRASELDIREKPVLEKCCHDPACPKCKGTGEFVYKKHWRVGLQQSNTLIIDIDGDNVGNMQYIKNGYEVLLNCKFEVIQTNGGYWLISDKKYSTLNEWIFDNCRLLNPKLQYAEMDKYIEQLEELSVNPDKSWKKMCAEDIRKSSLYHGIGEFDVLFTHLSIKWKKCTIRISKKRPDDKIEVIK